jgi:hypothetical protein
MSIPYVAFLGLLDTLASQYFETGRAECTGKDFGGQTHQNARDFFSVAIVSTPLPRNIAALGVLYDDSASIPGRRAFTFAVYLDTSIIKDEGVRKIFSKLIIAHEICHFAFYYELFINLGAEISSVIHSEFKNIVSGKLEKSITKEKDSTIETIIDEHNAQELIKSWGNYPASHFAKRRETGLNYKELFYRFFGYM